VVVKDYAPAKPVTDWSAGDTIRLMNLILVLILGVIAGTAAYILTLRLDVHSPEVVPDDVTVPEPTLVKPPPHVRWPEVEETVAPQTENPVAREEKR
jgi:hypothetical protein